MQEDYGKVATFVEAAVMELGGFDPPTTAKLMDFGCGRGQLVEALTRLGFDACGCDVAPWPGDDSPPSDRVSMIYLDPYRLPFDDDTFDVVISTSVLEHARNKAECFREIHRVLRPGGCAIHLFPGKWYLPYEPHLYVPLVNYFWPHCPAWWLRMWGLLGVRNDFQHGSPWKAVAETNLRYCDEGLSYWTTRQYRELSLETFGNCRWPMRFYVDHAPGGFSRVFRRLPFKSLWGLLSRETRFGLLFLKKEAGRA